MYWMLLPLRRYAEFSGRSRRKEYWSFTLMLVAVYMLLGGLILSAAWRDLVNQQWPAALSTAGWAGLVFGVLFTLAITVPAIAVTVRRLHDRNLSGWWYLGVVVLGSAPWVGAIVNLAFIVVMALPGTPGPNRFGDDPKRQADPYVFG